MRRTVFGQNGNSMRSSATAPCLNGWKRLVANPQHQTVTGAGSQQAANGTQNTLHGNGRRTLHAAIDDFPMDEPAPCHAGNQGIFIDTGFKAIYITPLG